MSSKRAKRAKRKEQYKVYDPEAAMPNPTKKVKKEKEVEPEYVKLPGQWWIRVGGALLLVGGLLSAIVVWYSMKSINGMDAEEIQFFTSLAGQTPILYMTMIVFTSILAVMQFLFGYTIFRNSRNPFMAKRFITYCWVMIGAEILVNLYAMLQSQYGFNIFNLFYGCFIPLFIMYGAYKNMKFAEKHPEYIPPEPTQMF